MRLNEHNPADESWYDVQVDDSVRRIHRVGTRPAVPAEVPLPEPEGPGVLRLMWRAVVGVLEKLGPDDPPRVIAIIRAPERMYCGACGTQRVARYCPTCGGDVDRQYQKMVRLMARYVVDATSERREMIEQSLKQEMERQVRDIAGRQREAIELKMRMLERNYIMEIARQKRQIESLTAERDRRGLPAPAAADPSPRPSGFESSVFRI